MSLGANRVAAVLLACGAVGAVVGATGCGRKTTPDLVMGKQLFAGKATCGSCHTLARANTHGTVGPDLDNAFAADKRDGLGSSTIQGLVENQIAHPRRGSLMPAGLVNGQQAVDVAAYIAYAAALPGKDTAALATAIQAKVGPPAAATGGVLTIAADPTGALAFVTNKASAKPGSVKIEMPNKSPIQHNIAVKGPATGAGPIVGSGATSSFTVTLTPGTYTFFCQVPGHEAAGMKGTLTVK